MFGLISPKYQQIGDIEELQVEQYIFGFFTGEAAAQYVRNHRYIILVLDSGSYGNSPRASSQPVSLEKSVAQILIYVFAAMRGDIDIFRIKLPKGYRQSDTAFRCLYLSVEEGFRKRKLFFRCYVLNQLLSFFFVDVRCLLELNVHIGTKIRKKKDFFLICLKIVWFLSHYYIKVGMDKIKRTLI